MDGNRIAMKRGERQVEIIHKATRTGFHGIALVAELFGANTKVTLKITPGS